jgi:hypothetical protein
MSFNFPNVPIEGQIVTFTGGISYIYQSGVWNRYIAGSGLTAETRNRIVNPAMQISQENGTTEAAAHLYYTADQWTGQQSTSGTILAGRDAVSTPNKSAYRLHSRITIADTSLAAGDYYMPFMQWIEGIRLADFGWGAASGRPVVIRFGFRGPAGSYACTLRSGSTDATYVHPFTIAAGDANTDISVGFPVPAPAIGTWTTDTGRGMMFSICCAAGSTWQAPSTDTWVVGSFMGHASLSNGMAVVGNVFHIFDVGLYLDPLATGIAPPWQMPDYAQELAACMRYWYTIPTCVVDTPTTYNTILHPMPLRISGSNITGGGAGFTILVNNEYRFNCSQTARATQALVIDARL